MPVKIKAILIGKNLIKNPWGEKIVKLEFSEEREYPGPIIVQPQGGGELAREIVPIITQIMKSMPITGQGRVSIPRLTLFLTEEEWDKLIDKPEIGEEITIIIEEGKISLRKS